MDLVTLGLIAATAGGAATTSLRLWAWKRVAERQAREASRCDHVHHLPAGSRIVDLGRHGMIIDVGTREERTGAGR